MSFFDENKPVNPDEENICCETEEPCEAKSESELLREQIDTLKKQAEDAKNDALRAVADADNFRKRLSKDADERVKYAGTKILEGLLPVLDNLEMAIDHSECDNPLKQGVELTLKLMLETLNKNGLEKIAVEAGAEFDPAFHEALMLDSTDEYDSNKVTMVLQNGYTLNGRVIRPAKVKVNKK
jgi:molecular chaperone GrpE